MPKNLRNIDFHRIITVDDDPSYREKNKNRKYFSITKLAIAGDINYDFCQISPFENCWSSIAEVVEFIISMNIEYMRSACKQDAPLCGFFFSLDLLLLRILSYPFYNVVYTYSYDKNVPGVFSSATQLAK